MLAGHEIIAYWAGREACGLVSLLIMGEFWLGKNRSKWFVMRSGKGNMCFFFVLKPLTRYAAVLPKTGCLKEVRSFCLKMAVSLQVLLESCCFTAGFA